MIPERKMMKGDSKNSKEEKKSIEEIDKEIIKDANQEIETMRKVDLEIQTIEKIMNITNTKKTLLVQRNFKLESLNVK